MNTFFKQIWKADVVFDRLTIQISNVSFDRDNDDYNESMLKYPRYSKSRAFNCCDFR